MKILKNRKVKIGIFTALVIILGVFIYKKFSNNTSKNDAAQENIVIAAEKGLLRETVTASGTIESANYLAVTTSVNGIVKEVFVKEGETVNKGQPIMEITLSSEGEETLADAWSSYLSAKTALENAKSSLLSSETSYINAEEAFDDEKENNSYQTHDERISYKIAENAYLVAKSNYESQQESIDQRQYALNKAWLTYQAQSPTVVAPEDGVIANIVVVEGMEISNSLSERTSSSVASIKKEGTPIASLNISEVDINKVQVGQKVDLTLNSIDGQTFSGEVVGIDKVGTVSSGVSNYPVIVKFDNDSDLVLPNMGVDAEIIVNKKADALYVPSAAITSRQGKTFVRLAEGGESRSVEVETGISTTEFTEILSGIEEGAEIMLDVLPTSGFTSSDEDGDRPSGSMFIGPGAGGRR